MNDAPQHGVLTDDAMRASVIEEGLRGAGHDRGTVTQMRRLPRLQDPEVPASG